MEFNSFCSAFEDLHISWNPEKVFIPMKMFNQITRKNTFTNYLVDGKLSIYFINSKLFDVNRKKSTILHL